MRYFKINCIQYCLTEINIRTYTRNIVTLYPIFQKKIDSQFFPNLILHVRKGRANLLRFYFITLIKTYNYYLIE